MTEYELSKSLLDKRDTGVPMITYLINGISIFIYRILMIGACIYLYGKLGEAWQVAFVLVIGILLGATSQEIYLHYKGQQSWSLLSTLYDWDKIEEIVNNKGNEDTAK